MFGTTHPALIIGCATGAYFIGSVNLSILAGRLWGLGDLRRQGSGNAGATNLLRTAGPAIAVPVLTADIAKAFGTVWVSGLLGLGPVVPLIALPLLLGNLFPVFHGFKGGKGVAAMVGAFAAIDPWVVLAGGLIFGIATGIGKRVSAGSILMITAYPGFLAMRSASTIAVAAACAVAVVILTTHRHNIVRLIRGTEPRIGRPPEAP